MVWLLGNRQHSGGKQYFCGRIVFDFRLLSRLFAVAIALHRCDRLIKAARLSTFAKDSAVLKYEKLMEHAETNQTPLIVLNSTAVMALYYIS